MAVETVDWLKEAIEAFLTRAVFVKKHRGRRIFYFSRPRRKRFSSPWPGEALSLQGGLRRFWGPGSFVQKARIADQVGGKGSWNLRCSRSGPTWSASEERFEGIKIAEMEKGAPDATKRGKHVMTGDGRQWE